MENQEQPQITPEAIAELQAKAARAAELESELQKFRAKDLNFSRLRGKTEEEIAAMKEQMSEDQQILLEEVQSLRAEREKETTTKLTRTREAVLRDLAGDDAELKASIELQRKEWNDTTDPEVEERRLRDAYTLIKGKKPSVSPLNQFSTNNGYAAPKVKKNFVETETGKATYDAWFGKPKQ